ncbi:MAG: CehA/McbA family metallohydrolase [Kofleriaceae bacterium]
MLLPLLAVLSQMHYEADVPPTGGDYVEVEFEVPAGTVEIEIAHSDGSDYDILDWGVWSPEGFRGWGGGLEDNAIIGVVQSSRGYRAGTITPGTWRVVIGKAKLDDMGHYSIDVECRDNATLAVLPRRDFEPIVLERGRRWYRGDFHVHSEQSGDASATFAQILDLAKRQHLDFVNLSDHNTSAQVPLLNAFQRTTTDVLFLRGAEITTYAGHGNSVGVGTYVDHRIGHGGRTIDGVLDDVAARGGIFIVNHPGLALGDNCIGCAWEHPDADWSKINAIEVLTGNWDVTEPIFTPIALRLWDEKMDAGNFLAAVGGSDDHRAGMGTGTQDTPIGSPTTLVLADELSEAAIVRAVKEGRTIVNLRGPDDPAVQLTVSGGEIGDTVLAEQARIAVSVTGGDGMFAQIWRDGEKLVQLDVTGDDFTGDYVDAATEGRHRYRLELVDDGNRRVVITSHVIVTIIVSEDSCCNASARGSLVPASIAMLGLAICTRRRRCRGAATSA